MQAGGQMIYPSMPEFFGLEQFPLVSDFTWSFQQWVNLAWFTGLQTWKGETPSYQTPDSPNHAAQECNTLEEASSDEIKNQ
ncbi:hypothetical protein F0562_026219 [Nyssa sinensis]|uniref:Uncharacterized protein n=1 Tax=Nyssa sinensis TaxID=561372 RepID=A0A5J5BCT3_9ASTE|nr:hypothetical protein F0562_026219 [Nyssa sinensis]